MAMSSTRTSGGDLAGYTTDWNAAYGGKPVVPSPGTTASQAISTNIGNLGQLYNLAGQINPFQQQQLLSQYEQAIPGYGGLVKTATGNIAEELAGNVPMDVVNEIIQAGAERGILTGSPGSPGANAAMLKALGLTSLGMQQSGQQGLLAMEQAAPIAKPFDISSMFVTPEEMQQAQLAANIYASAPNPAAAALAAQRAAQLPSTGTTGPITLGPRPQTGITAPKATSPYKFSEPQYGSTGIYTALPGTETATAADPYADWYKWASGIPTSTATTSTLPETISGQDLGWDFGDSGYAGITDYASQLFGPALLLALDR